MNKVFTIVGMLFLFMTGCSSNPEESEVLDYSQLNKLELTVVGETHVSDAYLPGSIRDLALTSDGGMLVSDQQTMTIEQFDSTGRHTATIARRGNGPGELPSFATFIAGAQNDTLVARYSSTGRHDYFVAGTDGIFRYVRSNIPHEAGSGSITIQGNHSAAKYYETRNFLTLKNIEEPFRKVPVVVIDSLEQIVQDSLHILTMSNPYVRASQRSVQIFGMPPFQYSDRMAVMERGRYLLARPDRAAIYFFDKSHQLVDKINLNIKPRGVQQEDLDYTLADVDRGIRSEMEQRVPEIKPPFMDIWSTRHHLWLYTDESEQGKQILVLTKEGRPLGTFLLPRRMTSNLSRATGSIPFTKVPRPVR